MKRKVRLLIKIWTKQHWNASSAIARKSILLFSLRSFSFYFGQIIEWAGVVHSQVVVFFFFWHQPIVVYQRDTLQKCSVCLCINSSMVFFLLHSKPSMAQLCPLLECSNAHLLLARKTWAFTFSTTINFTIQWLLKIPMKMLMFDCVLRNNDIWYQPATNN